MTRQGFIIAVVLALLGLRACIPSRAQVMLPHRHGAIQLQSTSFTPESIGTLRYYWVASDLPTNTAVSDWVDRIQGAHASQGASGNQPTNSASGIHFVAASSKFLTNNPIFWTTNATYAHQQSFYAIITPFLPPSTWGIIAGCSNANDGFEGDGLATRATTNWFYSGIGGSLTFGAFTAGTTADIGVSIASGDDRFYTNGVFCDSRTIDDVYGYQRCIGCVFIDGTPSLLLNAYLQELMFFSNAITATDFANLHKYATNKYGYSP